MKKDLNLLERFASETPLFWKIVDAIGLIIVAASGILLKEGLISMESATLMGSIGGTVATIAKFAKQDMQLLESTDNDIEALYDHLPMLRDQGEAVVKSIKPAMNVIRGDKPDASPTKTETP